MKLKLIIVLISVGMLCTWGGILWWIHYYKNESRDFSCIVTSENISQIDDVITKKYTLHMENITNRKLYLGKIFFGFLSNQSNLDVNNSISLEDFSPMWWKHHWFEVGEPGISLTQEVTYQKQGNMYDNGGVFFLEYSKWNKRLWQKCDDM